MTNYFRYVALKEHILFIIKILTMNKLSKLFSLIMLSGVLMFATSCDPAQTETLTVPDKSVEVSSDLEEILDFDFKSINVNFVPTNSLTVDEIAGLVYMREEEKLAMDVYSTMFGLYGLTIFDRISASELQHTSTILELLTFYGIADPALVGVGQFSDPTLQQLYTDLVAQGSLSVEDALGVGALIEEVDILDLLDELSTTVNVNLTLVYTNLLNGSYNHLRAFVRNLDTYGIVYVPQLLDATLYGDIISSGSQGNGGSGNGSGTCTGNGTGSSNGTCTGTGSGSGTGTCTGTGNSTGSGSGTGTCTGTGTGSGTGTGTGSSNNGGNSGNGNGGSGNGNGSSGNGNS